MSLLISENNKLSKTEVNYLKEPFIINTPLLNGIYRCNECIFFNSNKKSCQLVTGEISPEAWCILWFGMILFQFVSPFK